MNYLELTEEKRGFVYNIVDKVFRSRSGSKPYSEQYLQTYGVYSLDNGRISEFIREKDLKGFDLYKVLELENLRIGPLFTRSFYMHNYSN